jgi:hypothetical protein
MEIMEFSALLDSLYHLLALHFKCWDVSIINQLQKKVVESTSKEEQKAGT